MSTRHVIAAADPARTVHPDALDLDVDALLQEFCARPELELEQGRREPRSAPPRRRRLDLALAAVVAAFIAAVAFLPASFSHPAVGGPSTSTPTSWPSTSSAVARATAEALLNEITLPAAAGRVSAPPARYLEAQREGLACKGTASASPRYWVVPDTTIKAVATYLQQHRPARVNRLAFNHDTDTDILSAYTRYRPAAHSIVVIALAKTSTGVGIRVDADVFLGTTCTNTGT